ncbi:hypothetical protein B8V81_3735 [Paenibacillus pasadenensis]|uniref:Uncharacterized protein n=1 Tax=Paenibacillus pasadenensis TaxID=217090 RepID=A0A2N5N4M5_9BACL|nr:hypothetical protein B8V81_3735 [Paenibacillus pasadenensis]
MKRVVGMRMQLRLKRVVGIRVPLRLKRVAGTRAQRHAVELSLQPPDGPIHSIPPLLQPLNRTIVF